jgi:lysozyme family protein
VRIGAGNLGVRDMSGDFEKCVGQTLDIEKGYVDNPNDVGGATNFGLSLRFLQRLTTIDKNGYAEGDIDHDGHIDVDDIKKLTIEDVYRILKTHFWDVLPTAELDVPMSIKWKVFDISVNCSPAQAIRTLQRALRVEPDGDFGEISKKALSTMPIDTILTGLSQYQMRYYTDCVVNRPANLTFLKGWTDRAFKQLENI